MKSITLISIGILAAAGASQPEPPTPTSLVPLTFTVMGEAQRPTLWTVRNMAAAPGQNEQNVVTFDVSQMIYIGPGGGAWENHVYLVIEPYATPFVVEGDLSTWRQRWIDATRAVHQDWTGP